MQHDPTKSSPAPVLGELAQRARAGGAPREVAAEALRVTQARFPRTSGTTRAARARMEAYFWGVVRRRALQGAAPAVSRRLVIASLEVELREAGHSPDAITRELARLYGDAGCCAAGERVA